MDLNDFLLLEVESMLEEFFSNFGLDTMRTPVVMCMVGLRANASLLMASHYSISKIDPALSGAEEARMLIKKSYLRPQMSDEEISEVLSSHIVRRVLSAGRLARTIDS